MRYKPKSIAALRVALGGLPYTMSVGANQDPGVSAKTVGELRRVTARPENLVITTPQEHRPESVIKVSRAGSGGMAFAKTVSRRFNTAFIAHADAVGNEMETADAGV